MLSPFPSRRPIKRVSKKQWAKIANAFYWAAIISALRQYLAEQGEEVSADYAHTILKTRCLGVREIVIKATGEVIQIPKSTAVLNTTEFSEFVQRCLAFLAELGIVVPELDTFAGATR